MGGDHGGLAEAMRGILVLRAAALRVAVADGDWPRVLALAVTMHALIAFVRSTLGDEALFADLEAAIDDAERQAIERGTDGGARAG